MVVADHCGLKPPKEVGGIVLDGTEDWSGIPHALIIYGSVSLAGIVLYLLLNWIGWWNKARKIGDSPPSFYALYSGKADSWLAKERGLGALHYTLFQRMICTFTILVMLASLVSICMNTSHEDRTRSFVTRTASSNLPSGDPRSWFMVIASALSPWVMFLLLLKLRNNVGKLKPENRTYSRSLMLFYTGSEAELRRHFSATYPHSTIVRVAFGYSTQELQFLLADIKFNGSVLAKLHSEGHEQPPAAWQQILARRKLRGVTFLTAKLLAYKAGREEVRSKILQGKPAVVFLTFSSHAEAAQVERGERRPPCHPTSLHPLRNTPCFAPLPEEVLWDNLRSPRARWIGRIWSYGLLFFFVLVCSTPAGFYSIIQDQLQEVGVSLTGTAGSLLPPLLLMAFGIMVPITVKLTTITFGHPSRPLCHTKYMKRFYLWLLLSSLIFPFLITGAGNVIQLFEDIEKDGFGQILRSWQCVFALDTGLFYMNYLITVALLKGTIQLLRVGDLTGELYSSLVNCLSPAEMATAAQLAREGAVNRSGNKLALADDFVWLVFYTTILFFFCFSCPLITPIYGMFLMHKHTVDLHNWRHYYTALQDQPELLITACKLLLMCSLTPQLNAMLFLLTRGSDEWASGAVEVSIVLFLGHAVLLLLYSHLWHWRWPTPLFHHWTQPPEDDTSHHDNYTDPIHEMENLTREEAEAIEDIEELQAGWASRIPGKTIFNQVMVKGVQAAAKQLQ